MSDNSKNMNVLYAGGAILSIALLIFAVVVIDKFNEAGAMTADAESAQEQVARAPLYIPPAEECEATGEYMQRFVCKATPVAPMNPRQELASQIRRVNMITNRPMTERRLSRVTDYLLDECPDYALDVYLIGVPESYNWNRDRYEGDYRIRYELEEPCEDCFCVEDACYSGDDCNPASDENCVPTSCGPFHIRHIYRDFECEDLKNERFSVEWMCDWMSNNYPNIAAHNAGLRGASTHSASDDYGYRHFLLKELVTSDHEHDLNDWGWGRSGSSLTRIVYLPSIE